MHRIRFISFNLLATNLSFTKTATILAHWVFKDRVNEACKEKKSKIAYEIKQK